MRADASTYDLRVAADVPAALSALQQGYRPFAGGTDVMVLLEAGKLAAQKWVSLHRCAELRGIVVTDDSVRIGAACTYTDLVAHPLIAAEFACLVAAAKETGAVAIQNRGTLGGNIANASPAADSPPALLVYEAELELVSPRGTRRVPYATFHLDYKKTLLAPDELISAVLLPRAKAPLRHHYRKVGTRKAQAISKVCIAAVLRCTPDGVVDELRVAFGSVAPVPVRARNVEAAARGKRLGDAVIAAAAAAVAQDIRPIDDIRSTRDYRLTVAQRLGEETLRLGQG